MQDNVYWLISITSDSARVSLVDDKVISQGQEISWEQNDSESLLKAIDTSLSSQNGETTSNCAFIVPPAWISADGKIFGEMLNNLKNICTKLKLHPLGQISYDEAFVESYNNDDSFPGSYILLYFTPSHYQISLVYLGEIKKRHTQNFTTDFSVSKLEQILFGLGFPSALPPKIIVTGAFTSQIVDDLKNYNWLTHHDTETFLHLPDVISLDILSLDQIFVNTIKKQIYPDTCLPPQTVPDITPASNLGFTIVDSPVDVVLPVKKISKPISFPKFNLSYYWLLPFTLLPFLPILPLFFAKVDIFIQQNPVDFNENFNITLDPQTNVASKTFNLSIGASLPTTGTREVGQKAKGQVTIFNKSDRSISVNSGLIIVDTTGKIFKTTNNVLLPASTYNLDTGVINMGQVKAAVAAQNIGPEYNLASNQNLTIKDNTNLLVKSSSKFTGGTREKIAIVTQTDKNNLLESAKQLLKERANIDINSQKSPQNSILDSTMVFTNQKTVFNREVGEVADILSLDLSSKVSFLYLDLAQKQNLISTLFSQKETLSILDKNSAVVSLNYVPGKLTLTGKANPKINIDQLKPKLLGKKESEIKSVLNSVPKYYQHHLTNSLWFLNLLHRLPVKSKLINIIVKD